LGSSVPMVDVLDLSRGASLIKEGGREGGLAGGNRPRGASFGSYGMLTERKGMTEVRNAMHFLE